MTHTKNLKKLTLCSLAAVICGAGQLASAHTGIKDQATEGKSLYTAFAITHPCNNNEGTEKDLKVIAQSVVFPNNEDSQAFKINEDGSETPINLADHIDGANGGLLGLSPGMVQDRNIFKKQFETTAGERVRGIVLTNGNLDLTAVGLVPFRATAPKFKADSCAKSLKVRIGIANYCSKSKNTNKDNRADIWIGHMTTKFNDAGVMPHDFETSPFWPTMTVNRTTPNACAEADQFDIAVQPSDTDIDNYLPIKGFWPN